MKKIKLTESQFRRLFESDSNIPSFDDGDVKEYGYGHREVSSSAIVHDSEGHPEYGDPRGTKGSDILGDTETVQSFLNGCGNRIKNISLNY